MRRSAGFTRSPAQEAAALSSREAYRRVLTASGYGTITTELRPAADLPFHPAEPYHQQYLDKNPTTAASAARGSSRAREELKLLTAY